MWDADAILHLCTPTQFRWTVYMEITRPRMKTPPSLGWSTVAVYQYTAITQVGDKHPAITELEFNLDPDANTNVNEDWALASPLTLPV